MRQSDLFIQPKRHGTRAGLIGPEAPLKPKHIWAFRQRSFVIQQKTGRPVPFEITEAARDAIAAWLKVRGQRDEDWLFPSRSRPGQHIGARQDARLVDQWIRMIDLESQGTELTASAAVRCFSSTGRPVTCGLANSYWVTGNWRALSDTSASRWTTPWRYQSRSICDSRPSLKRAQSYLLRVGLKSMHRAPKACLRSTRECPLSGIIRMTAVGAQLPARVAKPDVRLW